MKYFALWTLVLVIGCATSSNPNRIAEDQKHVAEALGDEVSLKADRSQLDELRKEIPEDQRVKNDELAQIVSLMAEPKTDPSRLRQQFQVVTQKKRRTFQDRVKKLRDEFTKRERKEREAFTKKAENQRQQISPKKMDRSEVQKAYAELDRERRDFYSEERERRSAFESEIRAHTKDFDSYMRDKSTEFNEQMKEYTKRYNDQKKAEKNKTVNEFDMMKGIPSTPLEP